MRYTRTLEALEIRIYETVHLACIAASNSFTHSFVLAKFILASVSFARSRAVFPSYMVRVGGGEGQREVGENTRDENRDVL